MKSPTDKVVFHAGVRSGNRIFMLSEQHLEIAGLLEKKRISFRLISTDLEQGKKRRLQGIFVPLIFAVLSCVVAWWIDIRIVSPVLVFSSLGFVALIDFSPVEFVKIRDRHGNVIVQVFRPAKNAHRFDEFVRELQVLVSRANANEGN